MVSHQTFFVFAFCFGLVLVGNNNDCYILEKKSGKSYIWGGCCSRPYETWAKLGYVHGKND